MRNPERIDGILAQLGELWKAHPDFRLGQLIMVVAMTGEHNPKLFQLEDEAFLELLRERQIQLQR
ncbi:hypothetical protein GCM10023185_17740 [Hymenobacter saemangeumensis]|uniref:DUF1040 family protein n=1 Tax=Hymenobacter saemangeumensis TaxID=1084522 RepID=A0ABP8IAY8_9BACT